MFTPAHWIGRKLHFQNHIFKEYIFKWQHSHSLNSVASLLGINTVNSIPRMWLKDEGPCLASGAMPPLQLLPGVDLCILQQHWGSAALIPYSPPTADSTLLCFVSSEAKGDGGSYSIPVEAKPFQLSCPQQNPTRICYTIALQQWWLTWTAVTLLLTI